MRILFLARHYVYFRNYESVIVELARGGHRVHLAVEREEQLGGIALVERLATEFPTITFGLAPGRADDEWAWVVGRLRLGLDYLRYLHPTFDRASKLRARARERTPGVFLALGRVVERLGDWSRRAVSAVVRHLERAVPSGDVVRAYLTAQAPDVLLLTPLIDLGSSQIEYLRDARALGIPTALCVWSWDHLSSKALIRESPDRIFVWNETQKREAIELHGIASDTVVVTGAQCFDQWFDREPSRDRETFCRERGFDPAQPILLWVCSALFAGSPVEATFVVDWIRHIRRSSEPRLRHANILVRPHPSRATEWEQTDVSAFGAVVWGGNPVDAQARADYFDSLYHSAAVVGINTSAFIEAGILGRPVHALVVPAFAANQTGTVHFRYLTEVAGGLLIIADSLEDHLHQLDRSLASPPSGPRPFVQAFVRPHGLQVAATPLLTRGIEDLATVRPAAPEPSPGRFWLWAVRKLSATRTQRRLERWTLSWRERDSAEHVREEHRRKAIRRAEERAAGDPARLAGLRLQADALDAERAQRIARQQDLEARWAARDAELTQ